MRAKPVSTRARARAAPGVGRAVPRSAHSHVTTSSTISSTVRSVVSMTRAPSATPSGRGRAGAVDPVSPGHGVGPLLGAAPGPLLGDGGEVDLEIGLGEDHRADVPALDHPPAVLGRPRRWRGTSTARTSGLAATAETAALTSGPRMASVTSVPSTTTRSPTAMATAGPPRPPPAGRPGRCRRSRPAQATARYMAPVSSRSTPSRSARARETVDLPDPAGPSMAMTGRVRDPAARHARPVSRARSSAKPG